MSTMQEFYDNLSGADQQKDTYLQVLNQMVTTSLDQLKLISDGLDWYFWTSPAEMNT